MQMQARKNKIWWARFPPSRKPGSMGPAEWGSENREGTTARLLKSSRMGTQKLGPGKESSLPWGPQTATPHTQHWCSTDFPTSVRGNSYPFQLLSWKTQESPFLPSGLCSHLTFPVRPSLTVPFKIITALPIQFILYPDNKSDTTLGLWTGHAIQTWLTRATLTGSRMTTQPARLLWVSLRTFAGATGKEAHSWLRCCYIVGWDPKLLVAILPPWSTGCWRTELTERKAEFQIDQKGSPYDSLSTWMQLSLKTALSLDIRLQDALNSNFSKSASTLPHATEESWLTHSLLQLNIFWYVHSMCFDRRQHYSPLLSDRRNTKPSFSKCLNVESWIYSQALLPLESSLLLAAL